MKNVQKKDESLEKSIIQAKGEQLPTSDEQIVQLQQDEQIEDIELQQNLEEHIIQGTHTQISLITIIIFFNFQYFYLLISIFFLFLFFPSV